MRPQIDIVIPSRGPARSRSLLLADLDAQMALLPDAATLCVCEGASAAQNRNSGARQGKAQWIAFLDDDVRLGPDWLSTLNVIITRGARFDVLSGSITSTRPANVYFPRLPRTSWSVTKGTDHSGTSWERCWW